MKDLPEINHQDQEHRSSHRPIPPWLWVISLSVILWFTWSGQQYLANNAYNDADSSYFVYGGKVLTQGGVLYQDFWDQKPPMIFYQNALLYSCFGLDFEAWAIFHGLWFLCTLAWLSRILNFCGSQYGFSPRITLLWAVVISFAFNLNNFLDFGNRTEFGLSIFEMLAMGHTLLFFKTKKSFHLLIAGALCASATLYKPTGMASLQATVVLFFLLSLFKKYFGDPQNTTHAPLKLPHLLWLFIGFFTAGFMILLPILMSGQILELWRATISVPLSLTGGTGKSITQAAIESVIRMGPLWGWTWPCLLVIPSLLRQGLRHKIHVPFLWLTLWTLATYSGVVLMRHGHPHYDHPFVIPLITLSFFTILNVPFNFSHKIQIAIIIAWCCGGLLFSKYFIVRQAKQSWSLADSSSVQYQPYRDVSAWLKKQLSRQETFYYWSMGYSPYLHSDKPCPGLISPCIITLGDAGAEMVQTDLSRVQSNPQVTYLLENPNTFPKYLSDPTHFEINSKARQTVEAYLQWRDQEFNPVVLPDLKPFLVYRKK